METQNLQILKERFSGVKQPHAISDDEMKQFVAYLGLELRELISEIGIEKAKKFQETIGYLRCLEMPLSFRGMTEEANQVRRLAGLE